MSEPEDNKVVRLVQPDRADEIIENMADYARQLEIAGRRLKQWCNELPKDYLAIPDIARGVARSATVAASMLGEEAKKLTRELKR